MISKEEINAALGKGLTQSQLDALHNARVAVVGLGGLGSNIAVALTRLGVSNLYLYDFDKVELSNLNRQYYFLDDIGQYKADALVKHLRQINPYAALHSQVVKVTQENIPALLGDCEIICEALDDAAGKAMLVSTVLSTWSDKKVIAGNGIAGFGPAKEITSKKNHQKSLSLRRRQQRFSRPAALRRTRCALRHAAGTACCTHYFKLGGELK